MAAGVKHAVEGYQLLKRAAASKEAQEHLYIPLLAVGLQ